jgi:endogenous inhibitor of DNA gyrase (YacG/DUF329 family)
MMKLTCPICSKSLQIERMDDLPSFPFCSDRCKLVDLGRWIDGAYAIPGPEGGGRVTGGPSAVKQSNGVAAPEEEEDGSDV